MLEPSEDLRYLKARFDRSNFVHNSLVPIALTLVPIVFQILALTRSGLVCDPPDTKLTRLCLRLVLVPLTFNSLLCLTTKPKTDVQ